MVYIKSYWYSPPLARQAGRQAGKAASQPASQLANQPASQPASQPATKPNWDHAPRYVDHEKVVFGEVCLMKVLGNNDNSLR